MNHALRILMLHRAPDNTEADVVEEKLRSSGICFTSRRVTSGATFKDELAAFSPDLILADYHPVREEGMAPLAVARHSAPHVPVIVLGDRHQHEEVARCVGGGATDYVLKDRLGRLVPSVQRLASEVRHRRASLAALEKEVRAQRVRKLLLLPLALMDENDICGILRRVAETAREVVSASGAAAFAGFSDGAFRHAMYSPPETALIIADSLPVIASTVRHQKRPLRIAGLYASTPSSDGDVRPSVLAAVPIIDRNGDVAGMISVWRDFGPFTREDESLLEQLAGIAALGLEALAKRQEAEDSRHEAAKNRRLLQCLLDNVPVAAAIADSDGAISNISRYAAERHAIPPNSSPHGDAAHLLHFRRLRGVGQSSVNDLPHCRALRVNDALTDRWLLGDASGGLVQVSCSAVPVRSDTGTAEGAVLLWEEVQPPTGVYPQGRRPDGSSCDRKQAHVEEVEQPEMRGLFRMVLDILPVGVWVVDKSGIPIVANAPATSMCSGTERHRQCHGLWSPAGKRVPRMKWPVVRALAGETVYAEVFEVDCCGTKKIIQMSSVPVRNATDIMGAIIVCADLTESKRTEEALKESEKKFRAIFEEAKSVICTLNRDRIVVDANPAAEVLFGWTRDNFGRINAADFFQNRECLDLMIDNLAAEGSVKDVESVMKRMDGHRLAVFISGVIVQSENGKTAGYRLIIHDMTERKELEQQLLQAQKMESVGLLAGGIAHDFNNLLTAISGYAQMIQESVPAGDDHLQLCVTQVLAAAERAAALTGKLLAFGRKQVLNPRPVLINDVISNTGRFLNRIIGEDIEFVTCLTGKKLTVLADTGQIEQVLMNLAANARDAMPKGGRLQLTTQSVTIEPGTEKLYGLEDSGRYALISVSDTGVGMDDKTRGRIFEPFFTTKEVGKGTGLGLSIIYGILQQHHGSVTVSSAPGKGTTFNLYLPLAKAKAKDEKMVEYPLAEGGNETILVAEDEEIVRAYLKGVLENAGYRVITAENGEEALKKFRKHQRDVSLVVTDVVMPRKNGQELFDDLAQLKPGLRVIFTSGYTDDILRFDGEGQAPWAFIGKPILKNDLLRKVRDSLDDPAVPDAAAAGG